MGGQPLRLRIGGNSMDSSTYIPEQTSPMVQLTDPGANANNQPVKYGPMLWDVLKKVATDIGGAEYLIGALCMRGVRNVYSHSLQASLCMIQTIPPSQL